MNNFEELKKAALGANLHGWTGFEDALNADGYSEAVSKFIGHCRPSEILALIAQLEAKNIRADACVNAFEGIKTERFAGKSIGEFLAGEVRLNKAEPKPDGSFGFTFSGLAIQIMAESFADQFKSSGAVNYLELLFEHSEIGPLTVTMQRVEGLIPAQKLAAVEAQLEAAQKESAIRLEAIEQMRKTVAHNVERAQKAESELSAANEKLKGEQVPVAVIVLSKNWPDTGRKVIDYYIEKIQHLPVGTELFTAPQKPVVLSSSTVMSRAYVVQAIKAAGFTVEGE
ncbi:TPA: hypothetical protein ACPZGA_003572 [Yersinia enterocolitica]